MPANNRAGFVFERNEEVMKQLQPVIGDNPADVTAGKDIYFVNPHIIEHQQMAGVRAPILQVIDSEIKLPDGKL